MVYVFYRASATIDTNLFCNGFHASLWLSISLIYRSRSSSILNNDYFISLFINVGGDKAFNKVVLGILTVERLGEMMVVVFFLRPP